VQGRLLAAAIVLALSGCATATPIPPTEALHPFLQIPERVASGVTVLRQAQTNYAGVVGNVTIIEQSEGVVLVDSGSSYGDGARVAAAVRRATPKPVTAVIITHWHNDHPLGLAAILDAWPTAQIISTEAARASLENGLTTVPLDPGAEWETRRRDQLHGYIAQLEPQTQDPNLSQQERDGWARALSALAIREVDVAGTRLVLPTRTFTDRLTLDDRRTPIEVRFEGRANTDGDAIVWLPRQRVLIAGDTVVWPVPYNFAMYPTDNIATLGRLRAFDYAALIPGHGQVQRDKAYLDLLIEFTRTVRDDVARRAREGATLEQVTEQLTLDAYVQRFAGDDPWARYWFDRYSRAPLIESAYREARGEPPS
jgi:glyoxylase-like metal-dependent hydrolase (beta-lactamase superfamily II)